MKGQDQYILFNFAIMAFSYYIIFLLEYLLFIIILSSYTIIIIKAKAKQHNKLLILFMINKQIIDI